MKIIWPQSSLTYMYSPADDIYAVFEQIVVCDTEKYMRLTGFCTVIIMYFHNLSTKKRIETRIIKTHLKK